MLLDDEQRMVVESVRELARAEFTEKACSWEGQRPWDHIEILAANGLMGANFEEEYGGAGMSTLDVVLITEAIGEVCPATANFYYAMHMNAPRAIAMFGTDEAKRTYLPDVVSGDDFIAIAISEPEAGSDVTSMNTRVTERNGELVLDGEKTWVSEVPESSAAVVWTQFSSGLGTVVMDLDAPGVEIEQHYTNMAGLTQSHIRMENVTIPEANVLTRGREAFKQQLKALNWERLGGAAHATALAQCAFDKALEYAQTREQFGQPIGEFQGIEWKLAEMATKVQTSRALLHSVAERADAQDRPPRRIESSMAWLYGARIANEVVDEAVQIHGANGYQQGADVEYLYRRARGLRIGGGTDEIQLNSIASELKDGGLPRF